jgi:long-chain acyl-CoA synthetase
MTQSSEFGAWEQLQTGLPLPLSGIAPLPLWGMLETAILRHSNRPYLTFQDVSLTYGAAGILVRALASGLQALGIAVGDRVGLCMATHPAYALAVNALWRIGAVGVGMNPVYGEPMLMRIAADSDIQLILTTDAAATIEKVRGVARRNGCRLLVFKHDAGDLPAALAAPVRTWDAERELDALSMMSSHAASPPVEFDARSGIAMIQYTGGTTGEPKGVMLTHANLCASCVQQRSKFRSMTAGREVTYVCTPLTHIGSLLAALIFTTAIAGELVLADRFAAAEALATIAKRRVTFLPGFPTLLIALMRDPAAANTDWTSLRYVLSAAAPTPPEVKRAFAALTGAEVRICYGSTETGPGIAMQGDDEQYMGPASSSTGTPFPLTLVSIRDAESPAEELPAGLVGEICVSGPQVMAGYWRNPAATAAVFTGNYLRTGDLGYVDEAGRLYLVDRLKDVINVSGYKVYPALIEAAVYEHEAIFEAIVIGVADSYRGETVKLFAVLRSGCRLELPELQKFLEGRLSPMEMPKQFEIRSELPKTAVGKLSRADLRRQLAQNS